ncbi:hypothetical protein Plhal304r1_c057g0143841 [Plasmopara halstedii]
MSSPVLARRGTNGIQLLSSDSSSSELLLSISINVWHRLVFSQDESPNDLLAAYREMDDTLLASTFSNRTCRRYQLL